MEYGLKKICGAVSNAAQIDIKQRIMRWKIDDAFRVFRETQRTNLCIWRECKRVIPLGIRNEYLRSWKLYTTRYRLNLETENKEKIKWLVGKWQKKEKPVPDTIRGIRLKDEVLTEEFNSQPRVYGRIQLNDNEKSL